MSAPEFFYDVDQGTPEWHELRRGIPTASEFSTIIGGPDLKGYQTYLGDLAGELLCGELTEGWNGNAYTQRGHDMEGAAAEAYAQKHLIELRTVGFVRRQLPSGRYVGCSPDRLFKTTINGTEPDSMLEIKTMKPRLMGFERDKYNPHKLPSAHVAQCQGGLWVTGLQRIDLIVFYRNMPWSLHYTAHRDEAYIRKLEAAVIKFDEELHRCVERWSKAP